MHEGGCDGVYGKHMISISVTHEIELQECQRGRSEAAHEYREKVNQLPEALETTRSEGGAEVVKTESGQQHLFASKLHSPGHSAG